MLMYGSSHFVIEVADRPIIAESLYTAPYLFAGTWVLAAGTSTAGTLTRWFGDLLGLDHAADSRVFSELTHLAEESPVGARGLIALPHFSGERTPLDDPLATGGILGFTLNHSRADVYRALLEGIAQGIREVFERYREAGASPINVRAVGGGTKNSVWTAAISDITGLAQSVVSGSGASYGDAMMAALTVGMIPSRDALADWVAVDHIIEPRQQFAALYGRQSELWSQFQLATIDLSHHLRRTTMEATS
jgi:xylulokinase